MNSVSLVGELVAEPELRENRAGVDECRLRIAVPRRSRAGTLEPGVVYVDVTTFGHEAHECAQLEVGARLGLGGRLEADEHRSEAGGWEATHGVRIDQLDIL